MRREHVGLLACPDCRSDLELTDAVGDDVLVETGTLRCTGCGAGYRIVRHIPRFVPRDNYADSFGYEWTIHGRTQYDSHSGKRITERRFFHETRWPRRLEGELVLEVGSGSGRFTEQAAATGATVVSVDLSYAVATNYAANGQHPNILIAQADIYRLPVRERFFDKVLCIGMLQNTPDPRRAFMGLPGLLKPGGCVVIDTYLRYPPLRRALQTKYWLRPLARGISPERLHGAISRYVSLMWPFSSLLNRLPGGKSLNWLLLVADYRGVYELSEEQLKEWAVMDTFDMLSPAYDKASSLDEVRSWFRDATMTDVDVHRGYNGIEGRGTVRSAG